MLRTFVVLIASCFATMASAADFSVERNVVYGMYSGLALLLDVYRPSEPNGYGIVFISGSGWSRALSMDATPLKETGQEQLYAEPLADAGYTVFAINHRAAPRFRHPDHLADAQRAVRFMRHHAQTYGIAEHIGAMGGSSGGHLVLLLGTTSDTSIGGDKIDDHSAKVQVVVARAAPTDLTLFTSSIALFGYRAPTDKLSQEYRNYVEASPVTHVSADDAPTLLIHGDADNILPYRHSEVMRDALTKAGVATELLTIPDAGHGPHFPGAVNPPDYISAMISWFDEHLAGK